jgi:peptide/nickel transport system substrate-binding protein
MLHYCRYIEDENSKVDTGVDPFLSEYISKCVKQVFIKYLIKFDMKVILLLNIIYASTLTMAISSSPSRINPILDNDGASSEISQWVFNGLFKYNKDGNIVEDLAQSYEFKNDTILIIKLRKDVLWHDGEKFSADDVIFTYNTIKSPKIFTSITSLYRVIKSVEKIDDYTIKIIYKEPYFKALELWMTGMLPYHILKDEKDMMTSDFNKKPIGTGPYILKGFKNSTDIELFAFNDYFEGKVNIDKILYKFVPDANTRFLMLKQNKLDIGQLNSLQIERQIDDEFKKDYQIIEKPDFSYSYLGFNLKREKFKDKRLREALSLAIDRQEIIDIMSFGHAQVCKGPFLPGSFAFNSEVKSPKTDIVKAKNLLKELGYDETNPFTFELITSTGSSTGAYIAQIIQHQLQKVGVELKIRVMEWQAFLNTVIEPRKFDSVLMGWGMPLTPDAYSVWHSDNQRKGGFNFIGYKNEEVDKLIKKGSKIVDREELGKVYRRIFRLIAEDIPYIFISVPNSITAVNKKIKNIEPALTGITHNQKDWVIDEK